MLELDEQINAQYEESDSDEFICVELAEKEKSSVSDAQDFF